MTAEESLVSANVRTLAAANQISIPTLARELGMSRAAFYDRLAGNTSWLYREVVALARYFQVDLERFTTDPRTRVSVVSGSAWTRTRPVRAMGASHLRAA